MAKKKSSRRTSPTADDAPKVGASTSVPADQAARTRILTDLDRCLLVEAAAGAGKTTSMVGRLVELLAEGKCTVDRLAAVTFTKKAASELRSRFQAALESAAASAAEPRRLRLAEALAHVERCYVGTIHSFCGRILRERPIEAGVSLPFVELDETADEEIRKQAWLEYSSLLFDSADPILEELQEHGLELSALEPTFATIANYPDVDEWPSRRPQDADVPSLIDELVRYAEYMRGMANSLQSVPDPDGLMREYLMIPRMVAHADLTRPAEAFEILERVKERTVVLKRWPGGMDQGREEKERWLDFVGRVEFAVRLWRERRHEIAMRAIQGAQQRYERKKIQAGGLNFQDLLLYTARLLRTQPTVRQALRRRWTHLLVDEFQDTDPIQAEVLLLLAGVDPDESEWRKCKPRPGSLFVVGDPKQSIYRFRRADVATYSLVKRIIEKSGGDVLQLSTNFRTVGSIVDWVNESFAEEFGAPSEYSPPYHAIQAGRSDSTPGELAGLFTMLFPKDFSQEQVLEAEAEWIARSIRRAIDRGLSIPRTAKELAAGATPAATPGDFLIVTPKREHLSRIGRKLSEWGIPSQSTGGSVVNESEELALLHLCLKGVVEPEDPVLAVAVLRSPLFGVGDPSLYRFRRCGGVFSYRTAVPEDLPSEDRKPIQAAFEKLRRYHRWLSRGPAISAIERIAADLGLILRAGMGLGGDVQAGAFLKAIDLLRSARVDGGSPAELIAHLGRIVEGERRLLYDGLPAAPPKGSVVRLMNLHKVKGLEAPVVFLAGPGGRSNRSPNVHVDRKEDKVVGYLSIEQHFERGSRLLAHSPGWDEAKVREQNFLVAEHKRLLYVAATRAGACMIVSRRQDRSAHFSPWKPLGDRLKDAAEWPSAHGVVRPEGSTAGLSSKEAAEASADLHARWSQARRSSYATGAAKAMSLSRANPWSGERADDDGRKWGTVLHLLFAAHMARPDADLRALAQAAVEREELDAEQIDEALTTVATAAKSEIWRRSASAKQRFVEIPFETLGPPQGSQESGVLIRGVVDLAFREDAGWVIVDYKTDPRADRQLDRLVAQHRAQVDQYARAWERMTGEAVVERGLFFTAVDRYVTL